MNKITVGVLSDTHLQCVEERFIKLIDEHFVNCDMVIHAGDIVNDELLKIFNKPVYAVRGNMDFFSHLPVKRCVKILNKNIGIIHGFGHPLGIEERISKEFENVDCIVYGHTHTPRCEFINNILFFNPGSPFDKRYANKNSIGILEITDYQVIGKIIDIKGE